MTQDRDDRRALRGYLRRFSWAVGDYLGTPLRRLRADLRDQTLAAAADVGMTRALADLGEPRELAARYTEEHGRRGPRGARTVVRVAATVAAVGLLVAGVVGVRALPRVDLAGARWTDPDFVLTADPDRVRYIASDIGDGSRSLAIMVRNPRPFPVTLTGVDTLVSSVRLTGTAAHGGMDQSTLVAERVRSLTVAPDDVALIWVAVSLAPCADYSAGSGTGVERADVELTAFGVTRTATIPLGASYEVAVTSDWVPPAHCTPAERR